MIDNVNQDEWF